MTEILKNFSVDQQYKMKGRILSLLLVGFVLAQFSPPCKPGCASCDPTQNICYECRDPNTQIMTDGSCGMVASNISGCYQYGGGAICARCTFNYVLKGGACVQDLTGCLSFTADGQCLRCGFGTTLQNGNCVGVINCDTYQSGGSTQCTNCIAGFTLSENVCFPGSGMCPFFNPVQKVCTSCLAGSFLSGYNCIPGQPSIRGCSIYLSQQTCLYCLDGYFSISGKCQLTTSNQGGSFAQPPPLTASPMNSVSITSTNTSAGSTTNTVVTNQMFPGSFGSTMSGGGGSMFSASGNTGVSSGGGLFQDTGSFNGAGLQSGGSQNGAFAGTGNQNIAAGNTTTTVTTVTTTIKALSVVQNCDLPSDDNTQCLKCSFNFFLNKVNGVCTAVSPFCSGGYNLENGNCFGCIDGYTLQKNGSCTQSAPADPNCRTPGGPNGCLACVEGYYISSSGCKAASPLCGGQGFDLFTGACFGCISGYQLQNGTCIPSAPAPTPPPTPPPTAQPATTSVTITTTTVTIDVNCLTPQGNICVACRKGFSLNGQQCVNVPNFDFNCLNYANFNCTACAQGFTLSPSFQCVVENCMAMLPQGGLCVQCLSGFSLNSQGTACVRVTTLPNCDTVSNGVCAKCILGYYLNNANICAQAIAKNCTSYNPNSGLCLTCPPLLSLTPDSYCMQSACKISNGGICFQCIQTHNLDTATGSCRLITIPNCAAFNNGQCTACRQNFNLVGGNCVVIPSLPANCLQAGPAGCAACAQGFGLVRGGCLQLPQFCQAVDQGSGFCVACASGYSLGPMDPVAGTLCVAAVAMVPNCRTMGPVGCQVCSSGYWMSNGQCQQVSTLCASFNQNSGYCTSCYEGYTLNNATGTCSQIVRTDPNCQTYSSDGSCTKCYNSFILNPSRKCILMNPLCMTADDSGNCTSCYRGYTLINGNCTVRVSDNNCRSFNNDGSCKQCSQSYYANRATGKCTRMNPVCYTINPNTGQCTSCYNGYVLNNGNCSIGTSIAVANCRSVVNGQCQSCSAGYYRAPNNTCQVISPLCATADMNTGDCLTCYPGYALNRGTCIVNVGIMNCRQMSGGNCVQCSNGYFLRNNQCNQISPLCATADMNTGACLSCYPGYALNNGACEVGRTDPNCRRMVNNTCAECARSYTMIGGNCILVNQLCKTADNSTGLCTSCYPGYLLISGNCTVPTNTDPNCIQKSGTICLYCANGYWLSNNACAKLTRNCQTYDQSTGYCSTCPVNNRLVNGDCVMALSSDANCVTVGSNGLCTECTTNFYVGNNGVCTLVSSLCADFNYSQRVCSVCIDGYVLQDGECLYPSLGVDANCERYSGSYCSRCKANYYLSNYYCTLIDSNCLDFDRVQGVCKACRMGNPVGANCI